MKNDHKIIILSMLVSILLIAGCTIQKTENNTQNQEPAKTPLKIGVILPLTGAASYPGEQARIGLTIAEQEINIKGGINGRQVHLIIEDSQSNPQQGVTAFYKLIQVDNVDMIIPALSAVGMAVAPLAKENQIPVIGIMVTAKNFTQNEWTFRYQPLTDLEIKPIVEMVQKLELKKIGVLYLNDELGVSVFNSFKTEMSAQGEEVFGETFASSESKFSDYITKLKSKGVDSIYIIGFDSHLVNIVRDLRTMDFKGKILAASTLSIPTAREKLGNLSEGIYLASPPTYLDSLNPEAKELDQLLKEKYNININHYNAISYDVLKLISVALDNKEIGNNQEIKSGLESLDSYTGVFGELSISSKAHEIAYEFKPAIIRNGQIESFN
jgi:branched-chain amino acid transport system substrate-binding protein